jgi:hypothetical protein
MHGRLPRGVASRPLREFVEALNKAEAMNTTILVMNAAPLVQMPRRFLSFWLAIIVSDFAGIGTGLHESRP